MSENSRAVVEAMDAKQVGRRAALAATVAGTVATSLCGCAEGAGGGGDAPPSEPTDMGEVTKVPVGKVVKLTSGKVTSIVSQPQQGVFKAFSPVCTHQKCQVNVQDGTRLVCPCHNSQFSPVDGSAQSGPATIALPAYRVEIKDGHIWVG